MTGPLLLLETGIVFSFVYVSVLATKLASAPVTELKNKRNKLSKRKR
jgi:hypothetical protein